MSAPRILVFSGSVRAGSLNAKLAQAAARELAAMGADVHAITLGDYAMPIYDGDLEAEHGPPEAATALATLMLAHAGVFIACPEYNASITPLLKNTIDWVSRVKLPGGASPFKNRVFALGAASPGAMGGYRGLIMVRQTLTLGLGATVLAEMVSVPGASHAFADDGALTDARAAQALATMASRLMAEAARP
jgi:NAD(P)H-dependent FMN reductase